MMGYSKDIGFGVPSRINERSWYLLNCIMMEDNKWLQKGDSEYYVDAAKHCYGAKSNP